MQLIIWEMFLLKRAVLAPRRRRPRTRTMRGKRSCHRFKSKRLVSHFYSFKYRLNCFFRADQTRTTSSRSRCRRFDTYYLFYKKTRIIINNFPRAVATAVALGRMPAPPPPLRPRVSSSSPTTSTRSTSPRSRSSPSRQSFSRPYRTTQWQTTSP